jgi:predicted helicase
MTTATKVERASTRPLHGRAAHFIREKLFDGLTSFLDLESRIAAIDGTKNRGDAFEVFAEAYLSTQKIAQADAVWPFEALPIGVASKLSLDTPHDLGVDGVFRTRSGEFNAYQVKFRTLRSALNWTELSTFMGLSDSRSGKRLMVRRRSRSQISVP